MKKITLKDIDGTIKGRAALVSMDLENPGGDLGGPMYQDFEEDENCADPIQRCWSFWESILGDFSTHQAAVIANERARYLGYVRRVTDLGVGVLSPEEYFRDFHND